MTSKFIMLFDIDDIIDSFISFISVASQFSFRIE